MALFLHLQTVDPDTSTVFVGLLWGQNEFVCEALRTDTEASAAAVILSSAGRHAGWGLFLSTQPFPEGRGGASSEEASPSRFPLRSCVLGSHWASCEFLCVRAKITTEVGAKTLPPCLTFLTAHASEAKPGRLGPRSPEATQGTSLLSPLLIPPGPDWVLP